MTNPESVVQRHREKVSTGNPLKTSMVKVQAKLPRKSSIPLPPCQCCSKTIRIIQRDTFSLVAVLLMCEETRDCREAKKNMEFFNAVPSCKLFLGKKFQIQTFQGLFLCDCHRSTPSLIRRVSRISSRGGGVRPTDPARIFLGDWPKGLIASLGEGSKGGVSPSPL